MNLKLHVTVMPADPPIMSWTGSAVDKLKLTKMKMFIIVWNANKKTMFIWEFKIKMLFLSMEFTNGQKINRCYSSSY